MLRTLALKLHLHTQHIFVKPPDFGEGITGLTVIKITQIVLKLCLSSKPTLFALNVGHRSIKTAMFSIQCSLRMLLFTLCIRLRNMSVINIKKYNNDKCIHLSSMLIEILKEFKISQKARCASL